MKQYQKVRVRFAPSPTGWLHIGSLRTVLYDYILAHQQKGSFVLRNEDTDQARKVKNGPEGIRQVIEYVGLHPTEGEGVGGDYGPYSQSQRLDLYTQYAQELVKEGKAYYCFCSKERLDKVREEQMVAKQKVQYDGHCRNLTPEEVDHKVKAGETYVIRQRVPEEGKTSYEDIIYGKITFKNSDLDDQVLLKSDGYPTYNFANVIDDHLMEITHILRGDEFLSSTPKHVLIYQAYNWQPPIFAHLPMVLNPDGKGKLSKRKTSVSVLTFLRQGYLPEALFNFLALLGWTPPPEVARQDEFYSLDFLMKHFSLDRVNKNGARFDVVKLQAFNGNWLRSIAPEVLIKRFDQWISEVVMPDWIEDNVKGISDDTKQLRELAQKLQVYRKDSEKKFKEAFPLVQSRARTLAEILESLGWLYQDAIRYDKDAIAKLPSAPDHKEVVTKLGEVLSNLTAWDQEPWEGAIRGLADEIGWKHGDLFMLLRWTITGSSFSPPLREIMVIMGKQESLERLKNAQKAL